MDMFTYAEYPTVNGSVDSVLQNVFLSEYAAAGCQTSFIFNREIYAVCGKTLLQHGTSLEKVSPPGQLVLGTDENIGTIAWFSKMVPSASRPQLLS
jgi:hypothetical protein